MVAPQRISNFIQQELVRRGLDETTAVEAARRLDEPGSTAIASCLEEGEHELLKRSSR